MLNPAAASTVLLATLLFLLTAKDTTRSENQEPIRDTNKWGYVDMGGVLVIAPQFDAARHFAGGYAAVQAREKWGYIDKSGHIVIDPQFEAASDFAQGLAPVRQDGKWGYVNETGQFVIQPRYKFATSFTEELVRFRIRNSYGFYVRDSQSPPRSLPGPHLDDIVLTVHSRSPIPDSEPNETVLFPVARVTIEDGGEGYIDTAGKMFMDPARADSRLMEDYPRIEHLVLASRSGSLVFGCGFRNSYTRKYVIKPRASDFCAPFQEGLTALGQEGRWEFRDTAGKVVFRGEYDDVSSFSNGVARVKRRGKYGYIDKTGKMVIPNKYDHAADQFSGNLALVTMVGILFCLDTSGSVVYQVDGSVDEVKPFQQGMAAFRRAQSWGFIDTSGKRIIQPQFKDYMAFSDGLAAVRR